MKGIRGSPEVRSLVLFVFSGILLVSSLLLRRGDLTSAVLVLCSTACFVTGVFLLALDREEGVGERVTSLLSAEGSIALCRICGDLGVQGNGWILEAPWEGGGGELVHFIPVSSYAPLPGKHSGTFVTENGAYGIVTTPSGAPLLRLLGEEHGFVLPEERASLIRAAREALVDALEVAEGVSGSWEGESAIFMLTGYRLIEGCSYVRSASPKCCTMYPCPVCSLIGCILSRGLKRPVTLEQVAVEPGMKGVRLVFSTGP